jgi:hypothetical protein
MDEKILTQHAQGKQGVHLSKAKYDLVRKTILQIVRDYGEISFTELLMMCEHMLMGKLEGSISWYATTVKLDLEARGEIERVPGSSPQRLRWRRK